MTDPETRGFSFFPIVLMWMTLGVLPVIAWMAAAS